MEKQDAGVVEKGRAEIDTRAPFKSVKEAVMLFGERVLAGEIYANKLKEIQAAGRSSESGNAKSRIGALTAEVEEARESLQKEREEAKFMAYCIKSLKEELEQAKKEIRVLKSRETYPKPHVDSEIEELKFVENATEIEIKRKMEKDMRDRECQKKRYVKFASPPALAQVIVSKDESLQKPPSTKKKNSMPIIGWIFSRKKG